MKLHMTFRSACLDLTLMYSEGQQLDRGNGMLPNFFTFLYNSILMSRVDLCNLILGGTPVLLPWPCLDCIQSLLLQPISSLKYQNVIVLHHNLWNFTGFWLT